MHVRRVIMWLAIAVSIALAAGGCGAATYGVYWDDGLDGYYNDSYYYYDSGYSYYSDCPRHWVSGPLDCRSCHYYYYY